MVPPGSVACGGAFSLASMAGVGGGCLGFGDDLVVGLGLGLGLGLDFDFEAGFGGVVLMGVGTPSSWRSSSTGAVVGWGRHSIMAPARTGVARRSSTGGGAAPAAANASRDWPAERWLALRI